MKIILLFSILLFYYNPEKDYCGVYKIKKRNDDLFQDVRVLQLNCDRTFTYLHTNCVNPDTSFGTWTLTEGYIVLRSSRRLKTLVQKGTKSNSGHAFVDFDKQHLRIQDSGLIMKRNDRLMVDTLYKQ